MKTEDLKFDFNKTLEAFMNGQPLTGENGLLKPLIKRLTEAALEAELDAHLAERRGPNRRNGRTGKSIKTSEGLVELLTPRDRDSSFEPQIVKKHQRSISREMESKILCMHRHGLSCADIRDGVRDMCGVSVSTSAIGLITDKIIDEIHQWQQRPLDARCPIVWLDAAHYKVREDHQYKSKAFHAILGVDMEGRKEMLGIYSAATESASTWLTILSDLQKRGVKKMLIARVDGLKGFPEAIESIFPETQVQLCIVHQVRNSLRYVSWRDRQQFVRDMKAVYQAANLDAAEAALDKLEEAWGDKYRVAVRSWRDKWAYLSGYFRYPPDIRRMIYTTNAIESVHRQFRKLTKTKSAFSSDNALLKLLYVAIKNAEKKWTKPLRNWGVTLSQLSIFFKDQMDDILDSQ